MTRSQRTWFPFPSMTCFRRQFTQSNHFSGINWSLSYHEKPLGARLDSLQLPELRSNNISEIPSIIKLLVALVILSLVAATSLAYNPDLLQDICVAINNTDDGVFVNGKFCKDPKLATADDFLFMGFRNPGKTDNPLGSKVTPAFVDQFPGINTLGISMARLDFAPYGLNPPHTHPRGTEILVIIEGTLYVGFVTSNQLNNRLFTKVLYLGDVFVFPIGLIHFQFNVGKTNAVAFAGLSSQNPGVITIANSVFGAKPPISDDVLAKAFQVDKKVVDALQAQFWYGNN